MIDHSRMRLGKKAAKHDPRRLKLAKYLNPLPDPPAEKDWTGGRASWGMMLNDSLGDCTIAGCGHAVQVCSAAIGSEITVADPIILSYYEKWDGYNPKDPSTDQGGVESDVLDKWRQEGFDGHTLLAYCDPDPTNLWHLKWAITLFGGLYIGVNLPVSSQSQEVWDVVANDGGLWGGHCVYVPKYRTDSNGNVIFTCITWGQNKDFTQAFAFKYMDEAHALLLEDFLNANDQTADAVDLASLRADLSAVIG